MTMLIGIDEIDVMNLREFHEFTITQFDTIQILQHLKLLPTKPSNDQSCKEKCNAWYLGCTRNKGDEGMLLKKKECQ
ncbi:unnamed protein product [Rotaria sordida]|uniref:Uncharacterized protein n=1 Tax=Rotaria sordida TaxID=392033 RepID=A0A814VAN6_9BILA|nr:unnamed protein product [Rotaria sordida]CAF4116480.1 unnamed protein product [Rotaria sordida]